MKKTILHRVAGIALILFFGTLTALAQTQKGSMTIQIPFEFQISGEKLPAGKYTVKRDTQSPIITLIQSADRKKSVAFNTMSHHLSNQQTKPSLVFKEYNRNHYLTEVRFPGDGVGYARVESKAERRLAKADNASGQIAVR